MSATRLLKASYRSKLTGTRTPPTTVRDAAHALELERYFGTLTRLGYYAFDGEALVLVADVTPRRDDLARKARRRPAA